jgi:hypothetical protein
LVGRSTVTAVSTAEASFLLAFVKDTITATTPTTYYLLTSGNWSGGTINLIRQGQTNITLTPSGL